MTPDVSDCEPWADEEGYEHLKHAVRRWKLLNPQDGQVQSPGRGRFLLG
jgi:hypothetical protein